MNGERDARAIKLTAERVGAEVSEIRGHPQTAYEAHVALRLAFGDFTAALRGSPYGRLFGWLGHRLATLRSRSTNEGERS